MPTVSRIVGSTSTSQLLHVSRILGPRMWSSLSMRQSLTSSPCQFVPFNR
jgi:hypothetical protein